MQTRFAPTTSGYLHLGHVLNALYVWGLAQAKGGKVLLRIEDHDRQRCKPEFETATLHDLAWLGFVPTNWQSLADTAQPSPYRQSDNRARYDAAIQALAEKGLVYACACTRKELNERIPITPGAEVCYDGHCRHLGLPWHNGLGLRVQLPDDSVAFTDLLLGPITQQPARQCGDLLARDRHGNYTYQFCVVVDDAQQGITHVVRGTDLLESTARQIVLAKLLGRSVPPRFMHHPLLVDAKGEKLSKRFFSESLAQMRARGDKPEMLIGRVVHLIGFQPHSQPLSAPQAIQLVAHRLSTMRA
jgi:glutamyl-tRNA synthetase/glutamyl-Q tRNA(Asp) synthetase